jgi:hypothetical protein
VARAAGVLGRDAEQARYQTLANTIAAAFHERWFDGASEYRNSGSPQCANSMALVSGLVPGEREGAVLARVVEDIRARGNQQTAGDIGHGYLLEALARHGRHEVIFDLTARTNLGSYGFIVHNGWTSMPEAWDADTGASMNHCMLGHIQAWFLGHVAGIQPDPAGPAYARCLIAPQPVGDLTWARGSYESVRGRIAAAWRKTAGDFELALELPPNVTATVVLPTTHLGAVSEGGRSLAEVPEIRILGEPKGTATLEVGGGTYQFRVRR